MVVASQAPQTALKGPRRALFLSPTSSSTRASTKGTSSRVTTGQGGSRARVKPKARSTGLIGSTGSAPKRYVGPPGTGKPARFDPQRRTTPKAKIPTRAKAGMSGGGPLRGMGTAAVAGALVTGALRNPVSKAKKKEAAKNIGNYNTRDNDGTVRSRKKVGPLKVGAKRVGAKKVGTEAENFDRAFAKAKAAGKKSFIWKNKKYSTKTK